MRIAVIIVSLCLAACIISCSHEKGANEAILTGRVTAEDTTVYMGGVKVFEKSHNQLSTLTDSAGYFRLDGVAFEEHNIYFEKEGYEPYTLWFEYAGSLQHPLITYHIKMKKIDEPQEQ